MMNQHRNRILIRGAVPQDLNAVMALEEVCFEPGVRESSEVYDSRLQTFPEGFLVADDLTGDKCIGYLTSERWTERSPSDYDFTLNMKIARKHNPVGSVFYVSSMGVLPRFRGQGIGEMLFETSLQTARKLGCSSAVLIVGVSWTSAIRIYQKLGFEQAHLLEGFFQPLGKPAYGGIVMTRSLSLHIEG